MVKPKCLVFAAPFGFGPAAKTIRIVSSLHDIFDCIVVSKGNALDFLLKHRVGSTKYFSGVSSDFSDPAQLAGFGMAISVNNVPAAHRLKALGFGKRTVMIDSLHKWRTEIRAEFPPPGLLATLVEDSLPGFEMGKSLPETCTPISTILTLHHSSDIVSKTPRYETLFHFGGVLSPVLEGKLAVQKLERWIRALVCGADFIAGRRVALGKLPPMDNSAVPDKVDWFGEIQPNEVYSLIKASRHIVTTPGVGFLEMAFLAKRPTLMLPPMNSTQLMHYRKLTALGFPGILRNV